MLAASHSGDDDWALRTNLQLCGAVSPPTYADLRTAAHLQTFDVRDGGAALLGDTGKLFLVNVFQLNSTTRATTPAKEEQMLRHVTLDPPLQRQEAAEVEQVKLNANGSQVLLLAKNWVKVLRLPVANKRRPQSVAQRREESGGSTRFLVKFEDGSEQEVTLEENEVENEDAVEEIVTRRTRAAQGKRVAFVSREHCVASVRAVGYFSKVRHVAWHPLSDAHIVILSDAEEVAVFNTKQDVSKPEQCHMLDFPAKARTTGAFSTCFCFGASVQLLQPQANHPYAAQIWDAFTCYILRSDGAVYALCPIVPYDWCASKTFLQILGSEVDAQIAVCKQKMDTIGSGSGLQSRVLELKSQKYWLQEAWAPKTTQTQRYNSRTGGRTQTAPATDEGSSTLYCYLRPHVSGISPDTWPLAVQGPVDVSPQSVVEGKNQLPGGSSATSLLVVPQTLRPSDERRAISASPFIVRAFTSGHVELVLLDSPIHPQWQSNRQTTAAFGSKVPALLIECLNLGIDDSGGKAVLERDATDPRLIYCLHSTGVHVINVSWVSALASGKQFTTLPKSSVRHVFGVSPNSTGSLGRSEVVPNVVGARVVKNVNFGHLLLLRLASGSFEIVNVSAASSELLKGVLVDSSSSSVLSASGVQPRKTLPGTLASMASSKSRAAVSAPTSASSKSTGGGIRSFGDIVEEKLEALSARGTRVTGNTLMHEVDDAVLAFVLERVKILYEDVEYIDELDQLMRDRLQLHSTMIKAQIEKTAAVKKSARDAGALLKTLQDKMERALAVQQNLSKRAAAVLQAVKENQPHLSRAERDFKSDLEQMAVEVRRMKRRVSELTVLGQRAVRSLESTAFSTASSSRYWNSLGAGGSSVLSNEKKKMCFDVLRAETQLIDDTKVMLEDLNTNLQQLNA